MAVNDSIGFGVSSVRGVSCIRYVDVGRRSRVGLVAGVAINLEICSIRARCASSSDLSKWYKPSIVRTRREMFSRCWATTILMFSFNPST